METIITGKELLNAVGSALLMFFYCPVGIALMATPMGSYKDAPKALINMLITFVLTIGIGIYCYTY